MKWEAEQNSVLSSKLSHQWFKSGEL